jgi:hypothetical protein
VWRRLATAAVVVLATGMTALWSPPAAATVGYEPAELFIMRTCARWARRVRAALHTLFRNPYGAPAHGPSPLLA